MVLKGFLFQLLGLQVVGGQGDFLVFVVAVVVVDLQVVLFLGLDNLSHKVYGGVVFTAVALPLHFHLNFA